MKKQATFYPTIITSRQMAMLAEMWGLPKERYNSDVIARAINETFQREYEQRNPIKCRNCETPMRQHPPFWVQQCDCKPEAV